MNAAGGQEPRGIPLSEIASHLQLRKQWLSEQVASEVLRLFRLSVVTMAALTVVLAAVDAVFIYIGTIGPADRLMTERVLLAVVGASIVQVGAAFAAIVLALFKNPNPVASDDPLAEE